MVGGMSSSIHGHDVIDMIQASGLSYTTETLQAAIVARFGAEARFHTCSAEGMDAGQLIAFFDQRGKFAGTAEGFTIPADRVCSH